MYKNYVHGAVPLQNCAPQTPHVRFSECMVDPKECPTKGVTMPNLPNDMALTVGSKNLGLLEPRSIYAFVIFTNTMGRGHGRQLKSIIFRRPCTTLPNFVVALCAYRGQNFIPIVPIACSGCPYYNRFCPTMIGCTPGYFGLKLISVTCRDILLTHKYFDKTTSVVNSPRSSRENKTRRFNGLLA